MKTRKLALLPGLRWRGHLTVLCAMSDGRYQVAWNALTNDPTSTEHWIGDAAALTAEQIEEWTGVAIIGPGEKI